MIYEKCNKNWVVTGILELGPFQIIPSSKPLYYWNTLLEINIAPENRPSQKEIHLPTIDFQGRTVSFREGNPNLSELPAISHITGMIIHMRKHDGMQKPSDLTVASGMSFAGQQIVFHIGNQ